MLNVVEDTRHAISQACNSKTVSHVHIIFEMSPNLVRVPAHFRRHTSECEHHGISENGRLGSQRMRCIWRVFFEKQSISTVFPSFAKEGNTLLAHTLSFKKHTPISSDSCRCAPPRRRLFTTGSF